MKRNTHGNIKTLKQLVFILIPLLLAGCFDFEANHMVTKFKVLAVQTEPPEIAPGEGFEMEVLYADPEGNGREVTFAWFMCINAMSPAVPLRPEMGLGACLPVQSPVVASASNDGNIFVADQTPEDLMSLYPEALRNQPGGTPVDTQIVYITAVVVGCAGGQLPEPEQLKAAMPNVTNPADLCQGGDGWATHKVLRVTPENNPMANENPEISRIQVDGAAVPLWRGTGQPDTAPLTYNCASKDKCDFELNIDVDLTAQSLQSYHTKSASGFETIDEVLYVTWFTNGGELDGDRSIVEFPDASCDNIWTAKKPGLFTVWTVAHDVRGGVSWDSFQIRVNPAL